MTSFNVLQLMPLIFLSSLICSSASNSGPIRYEIEEEVPVGTIVGNIRSDYSRRLDDFPEAAVSSLRFSLRTPSLYVRVDTVTGNLTTASFIDRERLCPYQDRCEIIIDVEVRPIEYYDIIAVIVTIIDINDNPPTFPEDAISLEILETTQVGSAFLLPSADDMDGEGLGVKSYELLGLPEELKKFQVDVKRQADGGDQVRLELMENLDREEIEFYSMTIVVRDGGLPSRTASLQLTVIVIDTNDNAPRLERENYEATLEENLPLGTTILQVRAHDPDSGLNGNLTYSYSDDTEMQYGSLFGMDRGWVYVKGLIDYEKDKSLVLTIVVADQGSLPRSAYARLVIYVSDLNDNAPVISINNIQGRQMAQVLENSLPNAFVSHVIITDVDGGDNGRVDCDINNSRFRLVSLSDEADEYKVVTAVQLDREERSMESVTMSCRDRGHPRLSAEANLHVLIIDENDNAPRFQDNMITVRLKENNAIATELAFLNATDVDDGINSQMTFRLQSTAETSSYSDFISISDHGVVSAAVVFDYEQKKNYSFIVIVSDRGNPSKESKARLNVIIIDVNDEKPTFDKNNYVFHTLENSPINTTIGRVGASDNDVSPEFQRIIFSIVDSNPFLSIRSDTGEIINLKSIDREEISSIKIKVLASNPEQYNAISSDVSVTIYVDDENDNDPVMTYPSSNNRTLVLPPSNHLHVGRPIGKVEAYDVDEGINARLSFSISNINGIKLFEIDPQTGFLTISNEMMNDVRDFHLSVSVSDGGHPRRIITETLYVFSSATSSSKISVVSYNNNDDNDNINYFTFEGGNNVVMLVGIVCGAVIVITIVVMTIVCFRVYKCKIKNKRKYNCRLETNKAISSASVNMFYPAAVDGGKDNEDGQRSFGEKGKKGVRFNLNEEDEGPYISSPILDSKLTCPFPDECAFHRHDNHSSSTPSSSSVHQPLFTFNRTEDTRKNDKQLMTFYHQLQQPILLPIIIPQRNRINNNDPILFRGQPLNQATLRCPPHSIDRSSSAVRTESGGDRWSSGSLPDSGRDAIDDDDAIFYPGSQEPFFPVESNV